jgi:hypothetical protein
MAVIKLRYAANEPAAVQAKLGAVQISFPVSTLSANVYVVSQNPPLFFEAIQWLRIFGEQEKLGVRLSFSGKRPNAGERGEEKERRREEPSHARVQLSRIASLK